MNPGTMILTWLIGCSSVLTLSLAIAPVRRQVNRLSFEAMGRVTVLFAVVVLVPIMAIPLLVVVPVPGACVRIDIPTMQVAEVHQKSVYGLWRWDWRLDAKHNKWVSLADWQKSADMRVQPITDNPKVRNLEYRVGWEYPTETDLAAWTALLAELKGETPQTYMSRQLYEFDEQHSRELAKFYNPLDGYQQKEFRVLLMKFLQPTLAKTHLWVVEATFSL